MLWNKRPAVFDGGFRMEGYWVWCGSVVKGEDGQYHMFASRWPKTLPMHPGWLTSSEVVRAVSARPEGPYTFEATVLPARGAEYWDGRSTHNPHIIRFGSRYLLYYMGSTHPFSDPDPADGLVMDDPRCIVGRANKRIGLAIAERIAGPWRRLDQPILTTRPGKFDSFLVSNPAPFVHEDGSALLIYKARRYEGHRHGKMMIGIAKAERYDGPYRALMDEPIFDSGDVHIEDPFIWRENGSYRMIAKDMDGNVCGEKHGGIYAHSGDGIRWEIERGALSYSRRISWSDGSSSTLGSFERPFLLFENGQPIYLFGAVSDGTNGFADARHTWNAAIPIENG